MSVTSCCTDVLDAAETLNEASGLPVLAFDWASAHSLGVMPKAAGLPMPGLISGYLKDTEAISHSGLSSLMHPARLFARLSCEIMHVLSDFIVINGTSIIISRRCLSAGGSCQRPCPHLAVVCVTAWRQEGID